MSFGAPSSTSVDQRARDAAAAAQAAADSALGGSGRDNTARAAAAQASANSATSGSGNDSSARAAAVAAQADADAIEVLLALRASRKRVALSATQSLTTASTIYKISFDQLAYATGAFAGTTAELSRITIPSGVSKVRVRLGALTGTSMSGARIIYARRYSSAGTLLRDHIGELRMQATGSPQVSMSGSSPVIDVAPGDYIELYAVSSVSGTTVGINADSYADGTYLEVEVIG